MIEIVVYLKQDYSENASIWVKSNLTKEKITDIVNSHFPIWYFYDIM